MNSSTTPKSNFKRYQRLKQKIDESSAKKTSTSTAPIVISQDHANVLLSPMLQTKTFHHRQLLLTTSPKLVGSSGSTTTSGIIVTPSPCLTKILPCIPSSSTAAKSPKNTAATACGGGGGRDSSAAAIHAFRISAKPSPLAIRIRQQILKSNEKAPAAAAAVAVTSPKSSVFSPSSSSRPRGNTLGASLIASPSITCKIISFNDKNHPSARILGRRTAATAAAAAPKSFQSPPTLKMNSSIMMSAETRTTTRPFSTAIAKQKHRFVSPDSSSSLQDENSCHYNRHHCKNGSTASPKSLQQATTTNSTKLQSAAMKTNMPASSHTYITKKDVAKKQDDSNGDYKTIAVVPPRSWSHEELMAWLEKHELLDKNNKNNKSSFGYAVNGQMVMRMSKAQVLDYFYDDGHCIVNQKKAETLFRRLRLESDRADRLLLKKRVAVAKGAASIGQ